MILHLEFSAGVALVAVILCVWRLTSLVCYEAGPFEIFSRLRRVFYTWRLGALVECFHCMSVWVAAGVVLAVYRPDWSSLVLVFAVSGGASLIERALLK